MPRGGKRPGAGAKPGSKHAVTLTKEQARDALRTIVLREMDALVNAQIANAQGLQYLVYRDKKSGKFERVKNLEDVNQDEETIEVWEKDPSVQAFTDLMNRALDKPKEQEQTIHLTGQVNIVSILRERHSRQIGENAPKRLDPVQAGDSQL